MRSQKEAAHAAAEAAKPVIECKILPVSAQRLDEAEHTIAALVQDGWSLQTCAQSYNGAIVYTFLRATAPAAPEAQPMAVR